MKTIIDEEKKEEWQTPIIGCICLRCGWNWKPKYNNEEEKIMEKPVVCPKCKSPYWNKPKK